MLYRLAALRGAGRAAGAGINSREKGPVAEQIQDLQALAKKFQSERLLRFAYVDLDQNVSWKSFVNDVGEN